MCQKGFEKIESVFYRLLYIISGEIKICHVFQHHSCYTTDFDSDGSFCRLFFPSSRSEEKTHTIYSLVGREREKRKRITCKQSKKRTIGKRDPNNSMIRKQYDESNAR